MFQVSHHIQIQFFLLGFMCGTFRVAVGFPVLLGLSNLFSYGSLWPSCILNCLRSLRVCLETRWVLECDPDIWSNWKMNLRKGQLATVPLQKPLLQHTVLRGRSGSFSSLPGQLKDGRRVGKSNELQAPRTVTYLMVGFKKWWIDVGFFQK